MMPSSPEVLLIVSVHIVTLIGVSFGYGRASARATHATEILAVELTRLREEVRQAREALDRRAAGLEEQIATFAEQRVGTETRQARLETRLEELARQVDRFILRPYAAAQGVAA
jgi:hypothetical protein